MCRYIVQEVLNPVFAVPSTVLAVLAFGTEGVRHCRRHKDALV